MSGAKTTDPEMLVNAFLEAFPRNDPEEILGYFADDATWHNIPMPPAVGKANIEALLRYFVAEDILVTKVDVLHQVARGSVVMNERIDHATFKGQLLSIPICGVFEVADGLITGWRDYFDGAAMAPDTDSS
jgi:limonene-1,2-epoxide hydrolase